MDAMYWVCLDNEGFEDQLELGQLYKAKHSTNSLLISGKWYGVCKFRPTWVSA